MHKYTLLLGSRTFQWETWTKPQAMWGQIIIHAGITTQRSKNGAGHGPLQSAREWVGQAHQKTREPERKQVIFSDIWVAKSQLNQFFNKWAWCQLVSQPEHACSWRTMSVHWRSFSASFAMERWSSPSPPHAVIISAGPASRSVSRF